MRKKIGLHVAIEIDAVLSRYGKAAEETTCGGFRVRRFELDDYDLYVLHAGVGEIAAASAVQILISEFHVDIVVNFGVVGGLTEEMTLARTVIVDKVVHYDMDSSELDGTPVGYYAENQGIYIPVTEALVEKACEIAPDLKRVICASADKFVGDPAKKAALHEKFGADICEMEAAAVAMTCNRNKVPVMMIKAVSDSILGGAEEFNTAVERASDEAFGVTDRVIRAL